MAKQEKLELDEIDLDNDLDFDSFFADDIDGQVDASVNDSSSRKAVTDVFKGVVGGAKSKFTDPGFLASVAKDSLPESYGQVFSTADTLIGQTSALYDEAIREVKPQISRLAKRIDKLVPEESKFFKKVSTKFRELAGEETEAFKGDSREQRNEQSIANSLASVFNAQNEANEPVQAREQAQDKIDKSIDTKRFHSSFSALKSISDSVERLSTYNEKVTHAYQKKSLELQFRSYFVQSELLQNTTRYNEIFKNQNTAVIKNTALPEFVKIKDNEKFREMAKGKFYDNVQSSLFGDGSAISNITKNLKKQGKELISGFKEGVSQAIDGLEQIDAMNESSEAMAEMGMAPQSKASLAGEVAGSAIVGGGKKILSEKLRSITPEDSPIGRMGYKLKNFFSNTDGAVSSARDSDLVREGEFEGGTRALKSKGLSWLLDLAGRPDPDMTIEGNSGIKGLSAPAIGFDNKAHRSITEVIPGYLSRIYREISWLRTNDSGATDLTVFDFTTGKFKSQKDMTTGIKKVMSDKVKTSMFGHNVNSAATSMLGENEVDEQQASKVKKFVSDLSTISMDYTPENIQNTELFKSLDAETASIVSKSLKSRITDADQTEKAQSEFTDEIMKVRKATPDIRGDIELFIKGGHGDILEELGLVKQNKSGSYEIDIKAYKKFVEDETVVSSDVNVKRNITDFKPKDALAAIKKTKVYNWLYKANKGDDQPHTGPMAQDVRANMGEEAAPNGKAIDLTTMNGINMSAIKALSDNQTKLAAGDSSESVLKSIKSDTKAIADILKNGNYSIGKKGRKGSKERNLRYSSDDRDQARDSKDILLGMISDTMTLASTAGGSMMNAASSAYGFTKDKVAKPLAGLISSAYTDNKDKVGNIFQTLFSKAGEMAIKVLDISSDVIFNKLPQGFKQIATMGKQAKDKIYELLQGPIDVFTSGDSSPKLRANLIKLGYYTDQVTGNVIKTVDDIKGPVINKLGEIVLTAEDIAKGLVDIRGNKILSPLVKLASSAFSVTKGAFQKAGQRAKNIYDFITTKQDKGEDSEKGQSIFSRITGSLGKDKVYDILVEIRDLIKGRFSASGDTGWNDKDSNGKRDGDWSDRLKSIEDRKDDKNESSEADLSTRYTSGGLSGGLLSTASSLAGKAKDTLGKSSKFQALKTKIGGKFGGKLGAIAGMFGGSNSDSGDTSNEGTKPSETKSLKDKLLTAKDKLIEGKDKVKDTITKTATDKLSSIVKPVWNDKDGSGKRDGDWSDRLKDIEKRKELKNKASKADLSLRYKSEDNIMDTIFGGVKSLLGLLSGGVSGIFSKAGSIFKSVGAFLGFKSGEGILKNIGNMGKGLLHAPGKILAGGAKVAGSIGRPLVAGVNAVKNIGVVSKVVSAANIGRNVLMASSLLTAGAGSAVLGAVSVGLSMIGAALASPVVLGAIAVAAVGYGAYKAYKYFTRDKLTEFEEIRLRQYGLLEEDKDHNHKILELEEYLNDGRIGYTRGIAKVLEKKIEAEEILSIFSIDKEDADMINRFTEWFNGRFKPFFLTHLTSLLAVNSKIKITELPSLKTEEKLRYLGMISFESGPYGKSTSPFKEIDRLYTNKDIAIAAIDKLTEKLKAEKAKTTGPFKGVAGDKDLKDKADKDKQDKEDKTEVAKEKVETQNKIKLPPKTDTIKTDQPIASDNKTLAPVMDGDGAVKEGNAKLTETGDDKAPAMTGAVIPAEDKGPIKDGNAAMQFIKTEKGVDINNINPGLLQNFKAMAQDYGETTGKSVLVTSGFRSYAKQEALHKADPKKAAPPGKSLHEFGLALDVNSPDLNKLDELGLMRKYGFTRPVGGEPWHTEPAGIQVNLQKAKKDKSFADMAIESSLFKGGGGNGIITGAKKYSRNPKLALSLLGVKGKEVSQSDKDKVAEMTSANAPKPSTDKIESATEASDSAASRDVKPSTDLQLANNGKMSDSSSNAEEPTKPVSTASSGYAGSAETTKSTAPTDVAFNQSDKYSAKVEPDAESKPKASTVPDTTNATSGPVSVPPGDKEGIKKAIGERAKKAGVDPTMMKAFAAVESSLNPNAGAKTSSAKGLFQFTKDTWKEQVSKHARKYNLDGNPDPRDINASTLLASEYVKSNVKAIKPVKSDPNITDVYLTHFLGAGGARSFLKAKPGDIAARKLPKAARANESLFYNKGQPVTIGNLYDKLASKISNTARAFNIDVNTPSMGGEEDNSATETTVASNIAPESTSATSTTSTANDTSGSSTPIDTKATEAKSIEQTSPILSASSKVANDANYKDPILKTSFTDSGEYSEPSVQMSKSPRVLDSPYQGANLPASTSTIADSGQGFGLSGLSDDVKEVSVTLSKSLQVQSEMLTVLKQILINADPSNMQETKDKLVKVANEQKTPRPLSASSIDLTRKAV